MLARSCNNERRRSMRGFTMLEVTVTLVVISIVSLGANSLIQGLLSANRTLTEAQVYNNIASNAISAKNVRNSSANAEGFDCADFRKAVQDEFNDEPVMSQCNGNAMASTFGDSTVVDGSVRAGTWAVELHNDGATQPTYDLVLVHVTAGGGLYSKRYETTYQDSTLAVTTASNQTHWIGSCVSGQEPFTSQAVSASDANPCKTP
jgi:prepilin-type N-terminal cleavage/methylation domain-containing protein